jgi:hypothetical protein
MIHSIFALLPYKVQHKIKDSIIGDFFDFFRILKFTSSTRDSYSQTGEDLLIQEFLPEQKGKYIDIGSGNPVIFSNTFLLYKHGWRGTLIDPIQRNIRLSKILRVKDRSICALVGPGQVQDFWVFYPYEYSTTVQTVANKVILGGRARLVRTRKIKTIQVKELIGEISPTDPFFLSVDCEGFDLEVLKSINWSISRPRVVCVEEISNENQNHFPIFEFLSSLDYIKVTHSELSSIYVQKIWLNLNSNR